MAAQKYRKKPVVIEAMLYEGGTMHAKKVTDWMSFYGAMDTKVKAHYHDGELVIRTLEGDMLVSPGDFVIRGVKGEFYPCKPDIFAATYDTVA